MKKLLVTLSCGFLLACGGGGSGGDSGASGGGGSGGDFGAGSEALSKYAGEWLQVCHGSRRTALTIALSSGQLSISDRDDIFSNSDCTGNIIATIRDSNVVVINYVATVPNATITQLTGVNTTGSVDSLSVVVTHGTLSISGSGVTSSSLSNGGRTLSYTLTGTSTFSGSQTLSSIPGTTESVSVGLALVNGDLLSMNPSGSAWVVNNRYIR